MALVVVCGLPCSGRTTRSDQLKSYFQAQFSESAPSSPHSASDTFHIKRCVILSDATLSSEQKSRESYALQSTEKPARAAYLSLVVRHLALDSIVIADGGAGTNIKGFRYQLWCAAREAGVRFACVFVSATREDCERRNAQKSSNLDEGLDSGKAVAWNQETLKELCSRFEEPTSMSRWDSPLFVVPSYGLQDEPRPVEADGSSAIALGWEEPPYAEIWSACVEGKQVKAPNVVAPVRATTNSYLSLLESATQKILAAYAVQLSSDLVPRHGGDLRLPLPAASTSDATGPSPIILSLPMGQRPPTLAALQRLKRTFVRLHSSGSSANTVLGTAVQSEGTRNAASAATKNDAPSALPRRRIIGMGKANAAQDDSALDSGATSERSPLQAPLMHDAAAAPGKAAPPASTSQDAAISTEEQIIRRFVAWLQEALSSASPAG